MANYTRRPGSGRSTRGKKDDKYTRVAGSGTATRGGGKYTRKPGSGGRHKPITGVPRSSTSAVFDPKKPTPAKTASTARKAQRLAGKTPEQKTARAKRYQKRRGLI